MQRRKEVQEQQLETRSQQKGLIIVHTGNGNGKTTAALGSMVLRSHPPRFEAKVPKPLMP
jgi:cob(I)alamin adenosyltransferase